MNQTEKMLAAGSELLMESNPNQDVEALNQASKLLRQKILTEGQELIERYSWLKNQDLIGTGILAGVVAAVASVSTAYLMGWIPAWLAVVVMAVTMSIAHEMEHDLIHDLFFSSHKNLQKYAMYLIWFIKLHSNPFWRKKVHLRHHVYSGQVQDWEERLLGLGSSFNLRRLIPILHPFGQVVHFRAIRKLDRSFKPNEVVQANRSAAIVFSLLLGLEVLNLALSEKLHQMAPGTMWSIVSSLTVLWILPSVIRNAALSLVTTAVHYGGDIPRGAVYFENQILDHWLFMPLQVFCFNFGESHIIHHYVPYQPFYVRAVVAKRVKKQLIDAGVRHNDLGIFARAHRWHKAHQKTV